MDRSSLLIERPATRRSSPHALHMREQVNTAGKAMRDVLAAGCLVDSVHTTAQGTTIRLHQPPTRLACYGDAVRSTRTLCGQRETTMTVTRRGVRLEWAVS